MMGIEYEDVADAAAQSKEDGIEPTTRNVQAIPERARPPIFVGTHTHLGRLEANILMGRGAGVPGGLVRSINPHPRCSSRRRWITAPAWMEKELAEYARRLEGGEELRPNLDDPRYRALSLCAQLFDAMAGTGRRSSHTSIESLGDMGGLSQPKAETASHVDPSSLAVSVSNFG